MFCYAVITNLLLLYYKINSKELDGFRFLKKIKFQTNLNFLSSISIIYFSDNSKDRLYEVKCKKKHIFQSLNL